MYFNGCIDVNWYNYRYCGMRKILKPFLLFSLCLCICLSSVTTANAYVIKVNNTKYGYSTLNKNDKKIYKKILTAINNMNQTVDFAKYKNVKHLMKYALLWGDDKSQHFCPAVKLPIDF